LRAETDIAFSHSSARRQFHIWFNQIAIFYPFLGERLGLSNCMKIRMLLTSKAGT